MKTTQKGFTLIELLVVIAIIGILSGIVLVSLGGARANARDARRQADIRQISTAMELYYNGSNAYISSVGMPGVIGTFLPTVPKDPAGAGTTVYGWVDNTGDAQDYCTYATLEKDSITAGNVIYMAAGPAGVKEVDADPDTFTFSLSNCE